MESVCRVALNGIDLTDLDRDITIRDVAEHPPVMRNAVYPLAGGGSVMTGQKRESLTVEVLVDIAGRSPLHRQLLMDKLAGWCGSGRLTLSSRPDRYLQVVCEEGPVPGSHRRWTDPVRLRFTAFAVPYWQHMTAACASSPNAKQHTLSLPVGGTADKTVLEADITFAQSPEKIILRTEFSFMELTAPDIPAGGMLTIRQDAWGRTVISAEKSGETTSRMACRTIASSDRLEIACGRTNIIRLESDRDIAVTIRARGLDK
ncbi:MAG: hypothetical protein Q4C54_03925 [Clostridia bacterium]|nr:hypothetical protein [Clostridia bacterium]